MKIKVEPLLELRPLSLSSAQTIFDSIHSSRNHLGKWLPFVSATKSVNDTKNFINSVLNSKNQKPDMIFEIWFKDAFAGLIGYKEIDNTNHKVELGYWLDKNHMNKGIAVKATDAVVKHAFLNMKMNRVTIKVAVGNQRSAVIPKKLGFTFEGLEKAGEYFNDHYLDLEVYRLLKKEWN